MRVALVLNGEPPGPAELAMLAGCDAVVAADGGAAALLDAGVVPDLVVGDLDSLGEERAQDAEARGARVQRLPPAKDATDGERALEAALQMRPRSLLVVGAHGGRSAMFVANLHLLRRARDAGVDAAIAGRGETLRYLGPGERLPLRGLRGCTLNLLAAEPSVVRLTGTLWASDALRLRPDRAVGVSNRVVDEAGSVEVLQGLVLVVVEGAGA